MHLEFREKHLFHILNNFDNQTRPLDVFLRIYFKEHRSIGSHDRKYLAETIYKLIRWNGLFDYFCSEKPNWKEKLSLLEKITPEDFLEDDSIPLYQRLSFPRDYFLYIEEELGTSKAKEFCLESNYPAPTTIRANLLKTDRATLLEKLRKLMPCSEGEVAPNSIQLDRRGNFFGLSEFKEGLFEVQDEGSQIIALQVKAKPGDHVLDFCSGSGGKSLAIAPTMEGKGQLYLHDIRSQVFPEAKKRLKRAGIQNAQFVSFDDRKKNTLKSRMDWVLADVPCSGSGTLRRNPDLKWRFQRNSLENLLNSQREIFEQALSFVKPKGHIVYATCSVLPSENQKQIEHFLKQYSLKLIEPPFQSFPKRGGMDGFFAAVLQKI